MEFSNFKSGINTGRKSAFKHINFGNQGSLSLSSVAQRLSIPKAADQQFLRAGILGPVPDPHMNLAFKPAINLCRKCLSPAHEWPFCNGPIRCCKCLQPGHVSGKCNFAPQSSRQAPDPLASRNHRDHTLPGGPWPHSSPKLYHSFTEYIKEATGILPPSPVIIPWSRAWRLRALEFHR